MCDWKRWFWPGVLTILLMSALALWVKSDPIENDLRTKSTSVLESGNFNWTEIEMDGRDAVITGLAPSETLQAQSATDVAETYGVRVVDNRTDLMTVQSPYIFMAEKTGNAVVLSGFAPDQISRAKILAGIAKALPDAETTDKTELARGAPDGFQAMAEFGFKQLSGLMDGTFAWSDRELTIEGTARDFETYESVTTTLAKVLPDGSRLAESAITPPLISPYSWGVEYDGTEVTLTGHVPSQEVRSGIVRAVKSTVPSAKIVDTQRLASGEPDRFTAATDFAIEQLARFSNGASSLSDLNFSIHGVAADVDAYRAVKKTLAEDLPGELVLAKEEISPSVVSPYRWVADYNGSSIALTGFVPDEPSRVSILAVAMSVLPDIPVEDRMQVADGAPSIFATATDFAIRQLPRFASGRVALSDLELTVDGVAKDPATYRNAGKELAADLPASMKLAEIGVLPPTVSPYQWSAEFNGKTVILDGFVSDDDTRSTILNAADAALPEVAVEDRMQVAEGAPSGFGAATSFALQQLPRFAAGTIVLSDLAMTVRGVAKDTRTFNEAREAVSGELPAGVKLAKDLIEPPVISPYRWAADYDGTKLILNGFVPNEASRISINRAAKTVLPDATVEDRMEIATGAPDRFAGAAGFALRQLPRLTSGYVSLTDTNLIAKGTATNSRSYSTAKRLLGSELPSGLKLAQEEIMPPNVSPYVWSADFDGLKFVLTGYVPDEVARQTTVAAARDSLPGIEVDDRMLIAGGAPDTYQKMTKGIVTAFSRLASGQARLTDVTLTIEGKAKSTATFTDIESYLAGTLPGGMILDSSSIQPPAATGDYLWQATLSDDALILEGSAPSREARVQIEEKAKEMALGKRIENRMVVETGAPQNFVKIASKILVLLDNFTQGSSEIIGTSINIAGDARTVTAYESVLKSISEASDAGFKWDKTQVRPAEISPYSWSVEKMADGIKLSGFVPDRETGKRQAGDAAAKLGSTVENGQRVAGGAPAGFDKAAAALIANLVSLDNAKGTITDTAVSIEGRAQSETEANRIGSDLALALPSNFKLGKRITYPLPKVEPKPIARAATVEPKRAPAPKADEAEPAPESKPSVVSEEEIKASEPAPEIAAVVPVPKPAPKVCDVNFKSLFRGEKILFQTARAVILDRSAALLSRIAEGARKCDNAIIEVGGHTDSRGTRRYNLALSQARATAVVDYLTRQGVPTERLVAKGYGEARPIASNRRPKTRSRNRRIEFKVLATR